ncbi:hypothetical protein PM082_021304 [Marasmius tenuissimus]|nr:hypothetical protein PM082_021304 [Marasmius tenuissimus]
MDSFEQLIPSSVLLLDEEPTNILSHALSCVPTTSSSSVLSSLPASEQAPSLPIDQEREGTDAIMHGSYCIIA